LARQGWRSLTGVVVCGVLRKNASLTVVVYRKGAVAIADMLMRMRGRNFACGEWPA
jgi:hypothetical protein